MAGEHEKGCQSCYWRLEKEGQPVCRIMKERGAVSDGKDCSLYIKLEGERGWP